MVPYSSWFQFLKDLSCISSPLASTEGGFRGGSYAHLGGCTGFSVHFLPTGGFKAPKQVSSLFFFFFNSRVVVSL